MTLASIQPADNAGESATASGKRRVVRPRLARVGAGVLALGVATFVAGCYRAAVGLSHGQLRVLVPIAVDAPLAAEFLVLMAVVVCVSAVLIIAASRRRR